MCVLVLSQTEGSKACWSLSFEVACNFPHERSRDADISLPAGCNNQLLDEPKWIRIDEEIGLRENVLLDSRMTENRMQSFLRP